MEQVDLIIIGAGAAGLAAAIFAAEAAQAAQKEPRILLLEGAKKPSAKILISGGGRCNVTNETISPADFSGGPQPLIRSVLRAFDERAVLAWFGRLGVPLKLEPTGKYFPISDDAHTVLDALLRRIQELGIELLMAHRVQDVEKKSDGTFHIVAKDKSNGARPEFRTRRVIIATGGLALPKSGSDGAGYAWLQRLGHTQIPTTPALVPLILKSGQDPAGRFAELSGLTLQARLQLFDSRKRLLSERTASMLFTHFGISGPAALDISRHYLRARLEDPAEKFQLCLGHPDLPDLSAAESWLLRKAAQHPRMLPATALAELYPARLAQLLAQDLPPFFQLTREQRLTLAHRLAHWPLPVVGDRGYTFAEVTAGGINLREIEIRTMQSRLAPGLFLCGEILDVDGRIGGFNFQWAWASGYLAGRGAVNSLKQ